MKWNIGTVWIWDDGHIYEVKMKEMFHVSECANISFKNVMEENNATYPVNILHTGMEIMLSQNHITEFGDTSWHYLVQTICSIIAGWSKFLSRVFCQHLHISRGGDNTTFLGRCFQFPNTLTVEKFFCLLEINT